MMDVFWNKPIFMTGFMATGKTRVGRLLAERLARAFVDTDEMIVEAAGKSIPEIFEQDGEPIFRQMEHDCVKRASRMGSAVISLGGGAITQERNWKVIRETGVCLCLRASAETIFDRVSRKEERPLLAGLDDEGRMQKIRAMLQKREPFYSRADVFVTSTENRTPEETAEIAIRKLKGWSGDVG